MSLISIRDVSRTYTSDDGGPDVSALRSVSLEITKGEFVAIVGPSGGGKSTLLNILGLLDEPSTGVYELDGEPMQKQSGKAAAKIRSEQIGFIFQAFHLLEKRAASDSVELALMYQGVDRETRSERVHDALTSVGLSDKALQDTSTLSGGQRQRIAIARAVVTSGALILADEPTGNLDSHNAELVLDELERINRSGATVVVVTHAPEVAARAGRIVRITDGQIIEDSGQSSPRAGSVHEAVGDITPQPMAQIRGRGRPRLLDICRDAWVSVLSRGAQTWGQAVAVAIAVALTIATLGLASSASAQVSATFDTHLNREVSASWSGSLPHSPTLSEIVSRTSQINGVAAVAAVVDLAATSVGSLTETRQVQPHLIAGDIEAAGRLTVDWAPRHDGELAPGEALVGDLLANDLELSDVAAAPSITADGERYVVVGIITESQRLPLLRGEVLLGSPADVDLRTASNVNAIILTTAGAAPQVAGQLPVALNPYLPERLVLAAPTDPTELRGQIESGVQVTLTAFTLLALLVAIAALVNATLLSVNTRRGEIGMRKALGARDRDIAYLITIESAYVGMFGGLGGLVVGMIAILAVTISQRWSPVFDLWLMPLAIVVGLAVGACGGALASVRASRLRPAENLRA